MKTKLKKLPNRDKWEANLIWNLNDIVCSKGQHFLRKIDNLKDFSEKIIHDTKNVHSYFRMLSVKMHKIPTNSYQRHLKKYWYYVLNNLIIIKCLNREAFLCNFIVTIYIVNKLLYIVIFQKLVNNKKI